MQNENQNSSGSIFGPGAWGPNAAYLLGHPGLPLAISRKSVQNFAQYGLRNWHGLTFGVSRFATSPIVWASERLANRVSWKGYRHIHGSINFMHQLLGGGSGPQRQISLLNGRTFLGPLHLTGDESRLAIRLMRAGVNFNPIETELGLGQSISAMMGSTRGAQRQIATTLTATAKEHVLTGLRRGTTNAAEKIATYSGLSKMIAAEDFGGIVSKNTAWTLGTSRVLSSMGPFFGALNTYFVIDLAFKAGELGGQLLGAGANALRNASRSISRLEMGGPTAAFQTGGAITDRQRAIQAIQMNSLNARQAIGQEARYLHG